MAERSRIRPFSLAVVVSLLLGRFLGPISEVRRLIAHLTGIPEADMSHAHTAFARGKLLELFPSLRAVDASSLDQLIVYKGTVEGVRAFLASLSSHTGGKYPHQFVIPDSLPGVRQPVVRSLPVRSFQSSSPVTAPPPLGSPLDFA